MAVRTQDILRLEVPLIVRVGERAMRLDEILNLAPGAIIELPIEAETELSVLINNKKVGTGTAVKIGENFGVKITGIGDKREIIEATAAEAEDDLAALAEAFLAGQ
ncbi:MAG: FliM/FliN family flagellar motor switch protein [Phycisphaeraceae bacterium]|nr:FliM/FliN family flagellar motor switch protein [Phycisphaerales bacterium]MCB9861481.1 FliM/FliN family flagellar motor switch protein [Phycisphaeraceae bacterium]